MIESTPRQKEILAFIKTYKELKNKSPAESEIAMSLNISQQAVNEHLFYMIKKGLIKIQPRDIIIL